MFMEHLRLKYRITITLEKEQVSFVVVSNI